MRHMYCQSEDLQSLSCFSCQFPDPKHMQLNLTGFLHGKNARLFMQDLWDLLISAQENTSGIPTVFLEKKKEELRLKKVILCAVLKLLLSHQNDIAYFSNWGLWLVEITVLWKFLCETTDLCTLKIRRCTQLSLPILGLWTHGLLLCRRRKSVFSHHWNGKWRSGESHLSHKWSSMPAELQLMMSQTGDVAEKLTMSGNLQLLGLLVKLFLVNQRKS